jgi:CheY-like chemotaxis protein
MGEYARDSESRLRAVGQTLRSAAHDEKSTAPPPNLQATPDDARASRDAIEPEERPSAAEALRHSLTDCVHRAELLRAMLRVGGLSRVEGARALREELRELGTIAALAGDGTLEAMSNALRLAIEELGGVADESSGARDVLVWVGEEAGLRDVIAVAAETQGLRVRVAKDSYEFWAVLVERPPDVVIVRADVTGFDARELCGLTREAMGEHQAPIVLLVGSTSGALAAMEESTGADRCLHTDVGIEGLTAELAALLPRE